MPYKLPYNVIEKLSVETEGKELLFELNSASIIAGRLNPSDLLFEFKENEKNKFDWDYKEFISKEKYPSVVIEDFRYQIDEIDKTISNNVYFIFYISPSYKLNKRLEEAISSIVNDKNRFALAVNFSGRIIGDDVVLKLIRFNVKDIESIAVNKINISDELDLFDDLDEELEGESSEDFNKKEQISKTSGKIIENNENEIKNLMQENMSDATTDFAELLRLDKLPQSKLNENRRDLKTESVSKTPFILDDWTIDELKISEKGKDILTEFNIMRLISNDYSINNLYWDFYEISQSNLKWTSRYYESSCYNISDSIEDIMEQLNEDYPKLLKDLYKKIFLFYISPRMKGRKEFEKEKFENTIKKYCNSDAEVKIGIAEELISSQDLGLRFIWIQDFKF